MITKKWGVKHCVICKQQIRESIFYHPSFCSKECYSSYLKKWRDRNSKYHREWKEKNPDYMKKWWRNHQGYLANWFKENGPEFYKKHKLKIVSRVLTNKYIKIPKNYLCEICKIEKATDRHHVDYNKPFDIIFCCGSCHGLLDRERHLKEREICNDK